MAISAIFSTVPGSTSAMAAPLTVAMIRCMKMLGCLGCGSSLQASATTRAFDTSQFASRHHNSSAAFDVPVTADQRYRDSSNLQASLTQTGAAKQAANTSQDAAQPSASVPDSSTATTRKGKSSIYGVNIYQRKTLQI